VVVRRRDGDDAAGAPGVHSANRLNELSNREWLKLTKSVWLSQPEPRDELKMEHPATFAESDVKRLIALFTRTGELVLDPFLGSGSTLIACGATGRRGIGVELVPRWAELARKRLRPLLAQPDLFTEAPPSERLVVIEGDSAEVLSGSPPESVDFVVTSPPYWNILTKEAGMKTAAERPGLATHYSDMEEDLGNIPDYDSFLQSLSAVWRQCARVLRPGRYMAVIVSDFRHRDRYYLYHADTARVIGGTGLVLKGCIVLVQDSKTLYPYGIPHSFVPNVHHQQILVFQRPSARRRRA
jgi:DNA modification methylase